MFGYRLEKSQDFLDAYPIWKGGILFLSLERTIVYTKIITFMKIKSFFFVAVASAAAFAVSCKKEAQPSFVFNAVQIEGSTLQIMDRNVGAKDVNDPGNYYQYGKNTPVAYGADAALNDKYDAEWSLESEGILDWSVPANTPCPDGWRLITADDIKELEKVLDNNSMMYEFDLCTKEEYEACLAMADSMIKVATGKFQVGKEGKYLPTGKYFWTAQKNAKIEGCATMFEYLNDPLFGKSNLPSTAVPVRCVK